MKICVLVKEVPDAAVEKRINYGETTEGHTTDVHEAKEPKSIV